MSYCRTLTDNQVQNVLEDEATRCRTITNHDKALYYEAREECARRGYEPDEVLRERGVNKPK